MRPGVVLNVENRSPSALQSLNIIRNTDCQSLVRGWSIYEKFSYENRSSSKSRKVATEKCMFTYGKEVKASGHQLIVNLGQNRHVNRNDPLVRFRLRWTKSSKWLTISLDFSIVGTCLRIDFWNRAGFTSDYVVSTRRVGLRNSSPALMLMQKYVVLID